MPASPMVAAWMLAEVLECEEGLHRDTVSTVRQVIADVHLEHDRSATPAEAVAAIEMRFGAESKEAVRARELVAAGYDPDEWETIPGSDSGTGKNPHAHRVRKQP